MYDSSYSFEGMYPIARKPIKITKIFPEEILPREWQEEAFLKIYEENSLVQAFCGSGKSVLAIMAASADFINEKRKQLVIVPQKHIGDGFLSYGKYYLPDPIKKHVQYCIPTDFCNDSESKVKKLISFLKTPFSREIGTYEGSIVVDKCMAVATHAAFNKAMSIIMDNNLKLAPLHVIVDEAHHVKTKGIDSERNKLGEHINYIYQNPNNKFLFLSATPYRSDKGTLIPSNDFLKYNLDFIEHFKTLNIKNVDVNFVEYEDHPVHLMIRNILEESKIIKKGKGKGKYLPKNHHLVIVPPRNSKWRKNDPDLSIFFSILYSYFDSDIVLDLVNFQTQNENKKTLIKQPKKEPDGSPIKIIVTCMLGREGTDWCPCDRLHNLSIESKNGAGLAVQTFGRAFRKFKGKTKVKLFYYINKFMTLDDSETKREFLSERLNVILALMLVDDLFSPIELPFHEFADEGNPKKVLLRDVYGEEQYASMKEDIFDKIFELEMRDLNIEPFIRSVIQEYEMLIHVNEEDVIDAFKCLILRAKSKNLRTSRFDILQLRNIGFDIVIEKEGLQGKFYNGKLDAKQFEKFRKIMSSKLWTEDELGLISSNMVNLLSKIKKRKLEGEKEKPIVDEFIMYLNIFHRSYCELEDLGFESFYKILKTKISESKEFCQKKIIQINEVLPVGYEIRFDFPSNLMNKIPYYN